VCLGGGPLLRRRTRRFSSSIPPDTGRGPGSAGREVALCAFYAVLAMGFSWSLGQDVNWDLLNYHFYNPYLLLANRFDRDVHAAGVQSFLNPIFDVPLYFAVRRGPPVGVGLALGAIHGISLWLVHRLTTLLWETSEPRAGFLAGLLAAGTAAFGAGFHSELGSTMGDNTMSVFVLAALVLLLGESEAQARMSRIRLAGLLIGVATAVKYVAGVYVIGLVAMCLTMQRQRGRRPSVLVNLVGAIVCGILLTGGYWMFLMLHHYQSPLFPFYNALFRSPFAPVEANFTDPRFLPRSLSQALFYPFYIAGNQRLVAEIVFRDARLAVAWISLVVLGALMVVRSVRAVARWHGPSDERLASLGVFFVASYLAWLTMFSYYRYAVPLELIVVPLTIGTLAYALRRAGRTLAVALAVCLFLVTWTRPLNWGRVPWSASYFNVDAAALERYGAATVLMWDMPDAYLVPFFPESAAFLRLRSNWGLTPDTLMWKRIRDRVSRTPPEHVFFLEIPTGGRDTDKRAALRELGFTLDLEHCQTIPSIVQIHRICAVRRSTAALPG